MTKSLNWSPVDDEKLIKLRDREKLTFSQVTERFPGRSCTAVQGRYYRITGRDAGWAKQQPKTKRRVRTDLADFDNKSSRECQRPAVRPHTTLTGRLMGDPQPGRTPWAVGG